MGPLMSLNIFELPVFFSLECEGNVDDTQHDLMGLSLDIQYVFLGGFSCIPIQFAETTKVKIQKEPGEGE